MTQPCAFQTPYQTTLAASVSCSGIGLHSGQTVRMGLHPAEADHGIVFVRQDLPADINAIRADYANVTETRLGTLMTNTHGVSVSTIEHLMAALWGMGVDNALVTLDAGEVPIMDGSSEPFVCLIESAGVSELAALRDEIEILKKVTVSEGESSLSIRPFDGFAVDIVIEYPNTAIPRQQATYDFRRQNFREALCRARTFGFASDVEKLQAMGLARGGSLDNAIVVGEEAVLNEGGLRYRDEFVRHKALDCVGDLFLSGLRLKGLVTASRPGHGINNKLLRALFADPTAWRIVSRAAHAPFLFVRTQRPALAAY
jgi:UDP-3-O-[3-hydroxymyristoyl] N-acetylglucosamine deacetylase